MATFKRGVNKTQVATFLVCCLLMCSLQTLSRAYHADLFLQADNWHQPWRWVTTHLIHLNWPHLWLNIGSLLVTFALLPVLLQLRLLLPLLLFSCVGVSSGLLLWDLQNGYGQVVGFSGVLYGLLVVGAVHYWGRDSITYWVLLFVVGKIAWEQIVGASTTSEAILGDPVAVNAHLYGAISGVLFVLVRWIRHTTKRYLVH